MFDLDPVELAIRVPIVLLALTLHEFAHAYSAYRLGDPTAFRMGRCTLNPLAHLDPLGTLCLMFAPIGWAKPVPVNPLNLSSPRRDDIIISAAGPLTNLALALAFAAAHRLYFRVGYAPGDSGPAFVGGIVFLLTGIRVNVGLAIFNLLPVFPLDGFHVFSNLSGGRWRERMMALVPAGPFLILGVVLLGRTELDPLGRVMEPVFNAFLRIAGAGWMIA